MKKNKITFNEAEWRLVLHALNKLRTSLIAEGWFTDVVDEVLLKVVNASTKMVRTN